MNILFVSPTPLDETSLNGSTLIIKNLCYELSARHFIKVLAVENLFNESERRHVSNWKMRFISFVMRITFPKSYINPFHTSSSSISQIIKDYDRIVVFREDMLLLLLRIASVDSRKLIFYPIDFFPRLYSSLARSSTLLPRIYYYIQTLQSLFAYKIFSCLRIPTVYVSSVDSLSAKKYTRLDCIYTIPNGVSIEPESGLLPLTTDLHYYKILFSGDLRYKPNIQACRFIIDDLFPNLLAINTPLAIYIAGRGLEPNIIYDFNGSKHKLVVTGEVKSLTDYYLYADLYLSPLFSGSGIKNKIVSALHFGLPVLATSISLDGIQFAKDGLNYLECNSRRPSDWCHTIESLISSPSLSESLSKQGKLLVEKSYSWRQSAQSLEELF